MNLNNCILYFNQDKPELRQSFKDILKLLKIPYSPAIELSDRGIFSVGVRIGWWTSYKSNNNKISLKEEESTIGPGTFFSQRKLLEINTPRDLGLLIGILSKYFKDMEHKEAKEKEKIDNPPIV